MAPLIPFIPAIAAGIGLATAGVELANQPKAPSAPTSTTDATDQAKAAAVAAETQAQALEKRRGMASTVLTSPMGAGSAQTGKATLGA